MFVPFYEDAVEDAPAALADAEFVPFRQEYPVFRIATARGDDPLPEIGEAQVIRPEDWPRAAIA
jgi:hypothetical protein